MIFQGEMSSVIPLESHQKEIDDNLLIQLRQLEIDAIHKFQLKDYDGAILLLNKGILMYPDYGSIYNNLAQIQRILDQNQEALGNLELAIEHGDHNTLKQAYTQRGILRKKLGLNGWERDFELGAQYGNVVAKEQVKANPYAKLCNEILFTVLNETKQ
jgi:tetratricopeptide (TPR) repeat protein